MFSGDKTTPATSEAEQTKRRSERILLRLPIEVKGTTREGKPFRERTHTQEINHHGARIVMHRELQPGSRITVYNLQNNSACPFRVVGRVGKLAGERVEWGVECLEPDNNFWGIFFPSKAESAPAEELIDVLLECTGCHLRELAQLNLEDYQTISSRSRLPRPCSKCRTCTDWTFGFVEGDPSEATKAAYTPTQPASASGIERRGSKRVPVKLPIRIRMEEIAETENLSHGGVCFSSARLLKVGETVMVTVGYQPGRSGHEVAGRIMWREAVAGSQRTLYGVQLEK